MSQLSTGSICLTDLLEHAKKGHSAFSKSEKNGKIYLNFKMWTNDEPDQFGNDSSLLLNSKKDKQEAEGKIYIGNAKKIQSSGGEVPLEKSDAQALDAAIEELPF